MPKLARAALAAAALLAVALAGPARAARPVASLLQNPDFERGLPSHPWMPSGWDGKKVSGLIDPGPESVQIAKAELIPDGWRVRIEAHTKTGEAISFTGVIGKLGSYDRTITGTWTEGVRSYRVRMVRE